MIYETFTCALADGGTEFGYCFKNEGEEDCCAPDLVISVAREADKRKRAATMRRGWKKWEWMAKAICAAPEAARTWTWE